MKRKIYYLLLAPLSLLAITGCLKTNTTPNNVILPVGTFAGTFTRIHYSLQTGKLDTIKANIILTMAAATGYAVSGDTTHHAASHGGYSVDGQNIAFYDQTLPQVGTVVNPPIPVKTHLNGVYQYSYSTPAGSAGSSLQIIFTGDTVAYSYILAGQ